MMKILKITSLILLLLSISCSDGMQVSQKFTLLIKENNIGSLVIQNEQNNGRNEQSEYQIKDIEIENQFLKYGKEYINLGRIKSMKVNGNELEIRL